MTDKSKCLVCDEKQSNDTDMNNHAKCKLCGMRVNGEVNHMGFGFCSKKCMVHFIMIYERSDEGEKAGILSREIVI